MAGGIAHGFNNLLQAISGQIQFADRSLPVQSAAKQDLAIAASLVAQSAQFTRQLLDFGRRRPMVVEPVDLNQIVTRLAKLMRPMLDDKFELRVRMGKGVGLVMADASAPEQTLLNLCINARDAMSDGEIQSVHAAAFSLEEDAARFSDKKPGLYAKVSVSDTGCGMTDDAKLRVFEPFFTTKAVGKGSGLGLAMAYGVIKECGGNIDVKSSLGRGSTFTIWLPVAECCACPNTAIKSIHSRGNRRRKATVLYAEDDANVRRARTGSLGTVRTSRPCGDRWQ